MREIRSTAVDYYEVLGVSRNADQSAIKLAYRLLARTHHPDVSSEPTSAEQKLREINAAYAVLGDPEKRASYDRLGGAIEATEPEAVARVFDLFFGAKRGEEPVVGSSVSVELVLSAAELRGGTRREIRRRRLAACSVCDASGAAPGSSITRCTKCSSSGRMRLVSRTKHAVHFSEVPCTQCGGVGQLVSTPCPVCRGRARRDVNESVWISVPPESVAGTTLQLTGCGDAGLRGGADGDLLVRLVLRDTNQAALRRLLVQSTNRDALGRLVRKTVAYRLFQRRAFVMPAIVLAIVFGATGLFAGLRAGSHSAATRSALPAGVLGVCAQPSSAQVAADLIAKFKAQNRTASPRFALDSAGERCDVQVGIEADGAEGTIARDGIVVVVNPLNPISQITEAQLRGIYDGSIRNWSALGAPAGPITAIEPQGDAEEQRIIDSTLLGGNAVDGSVIRMPAVSAVTRAVAGVDRRGSGAIGIVLYSQASPAKMVPLTYLPPPNMLTIADRRYPLELALTLTSESGRDPAAVADLLRFARTPDGQSIVQRDGLVPLEGL